MMSSKLPSVSPFAPPTPTFPDDIIDNIRIYTCRSGDVYQDRDDLLFIVFQEKVDFVTVISKTQTPANHIKLIREQTMHKHDKYCQALVVNAGNANVFNGHISLQQTRMVRSYVAHKLSSNGVVVGEEEVLLASTGVIGVPFRARVITTQLDDYPHMTQKNWLHAAQTIMTTDTYPKAFHKKIEVHGQCVNIVGIAKGSGMISPNMATMLAFVFIDVKLPKNVLKQWIPEITKYTFNRISVDSDTSTNDTFALFAGIQPLQNADKQTLMTIKQGCMDVCTELAQQIVKDGEGITKLLCIKVKKAKNMQDAEIVARSVGASPLVKTSFYGQDANIGRLIMAIGKTNAYLIPAKIEIYLGNILVVQNSQCLGLSDEKEKELQDYLHQKEIDITIYLGVGKAEFSLYSTDLSHSYVDINASYKN